MKRFSTGAAFAFRDRTFHGLSGLSTDRRGQSPFVWSVVGAIAHATERLRLGTGYDHVYVHQ